MLVSKNFDPKMCRQFSQNLVGLFYLKTLLGFLVKILANFLKNLSAFEKFLNLKLVENLVEFSLENFDILIKIGIWAFLEWSCHVFWKFDKNLVGFSYEDFGKFSKKLVCFWKFFEPETCWKSCGIFFGKFWYSYQNWYLWKHVGFCWKWNILCFLVKKKNYELFENLVGLSENVFCDFQKKLCQP